MRSGMLLFFAGLASSVLVSHTTLAVNVSRLYKKIGTDPSWAQVLAGGQLTLDRNSTHGVKGSKILVNLKLVHSLVGPAIANRPIVRPINIHTVGNAFVPPSQFSRWSRWYQEDGNVQIFRLFKGETNVRNKRSLAARIEAYYKRPWTPSTHIWHEWSGVYIIIKPGNACIFQVFNNKRVWAVHLGMGANGSVIVDPRNHKGRRIIARNVVGKPLFVRVFDNGDQWRIYLDGKFIESGSFPCPAKSKTTFRWGMYKGEKSVHHDMMYFVVGATIRVLKSLPKNLKSP